MKKSRNKKRKPLEKKLYNDVSFRDKSAITVPILASTQSTSISIIDIDKFNYINGIGCQNNKDSSDHMARNKTIIYSDDNTSLSVSPKNTRQFQSRRIQVEKNAFSMGDFLGQNRDHNKYGNTGNIVQYRDFLRKLAHNETEKIRTPKNPIRKNYRRKISYPNVNIQLISMMLPELHQAFESNNLEQSVCYEKFSSNRTIIKSEHLEKNVVPNKIESYEDHTKTNDFQQLDVDGESERSVDRQPSVTEKEMKILKNSAHGTCRNNFFEKSSKEFHDVKYISVNETKENTQSICYRTDAYENKNQMIEELYFNDKIQETKSNEQNIENKSEQVVIEGNCSYARSVENLNWLPRLVKKVQTCFSFVRDILLARKYCSSEQKNGIIYRRNCEIFNNENISNELQDNKDVITLFYKKDMPSCSSTNCLPNLSSITSNHPDLTVQNPYGRNYFVYFSNNVATMQVNTTAKLDRISKHGLYLIKRKNFLEQRYSYIRDIARVILYLTQMFSEIYENGHATTYPSKKCFSSVFRIQNILKKVVNQPLTLRDETNSKKGENWSELSLDSPKPKERDLLRVNQSIPVCSRRIGKRTPYMVTDIAVGLLSSDSILVQWKVPKDSPLLIKSYKIFLNDVLRCTLMYCETCAVLDNVDVSKPLLITIKMYTADGYCSCTKIKAMLR